MNKGCQIAIDEETHERTQKAQIEPANSIRHSAYRAKGNSQLEIMLVTSRGTRRWIIPKGWPKRGMLPYDTAAKEAFEEAGVIGKVSKRPIGSYPYDKILEKGDKASCRVQDLRFV